MIVSQFFFLKQKKLQIFFSASLISVLSRVSILRELPMTSYCSHNHFLLEISFSHIRLLFKYVATLMMSLCKGSPSIFSVNDWHGFTQTCLGGQSVLAKRLMCVASPTCLTTTSMFSASVHTPLLASAVKGRECYCLKVLNYKCCCTDVNPSLFVLVFNRLRMCNLTSFLIRL